MIYILLTYKTNFFLKILQFFDVKVSHCSAKLNNYKAKQQIRSFTECLYR